MTLLVGPTDQEIVFFFSSQCPRGGGMPYDTGAIWGSNKFSKEAEGTGDRKKAGRKHSLVVSLKRNDQGRVSSFQIGYSG